MRGRAGRSPDAVVVPAPIRRTGRACAARGQRAGIGYPPAPSGPAMSLDAITEYVHQQIPITAQLGARVERYDGDSVTLAAPLAPNLNHQATAFGGSLSALAILAGWVLVHLQLRDQGVAARVLIQRSAVEFVAPLDGDLVATAMLPPAPAWHRFLATLARHRSARVTVPSSVASGARVGARHEGVYVAAR